MANLKRNMIELVKEVKQGEILTETYWTPPFLPMSVIYEANDIAAEINDADPGDKDSQRQVIEQLSAFISEKAYGGQFTKKELQDGLHAPQAMMVLYEQLQFITLGQQSDETKKFLEKKN